MQLEGKSVKLFHSCHEDVRYKKDKFVRKMWIYVIFILDKQETRFPIFMHVRKKLQMLD